MYIFLVRFWVIGDIQPSSFANEETVASVHVEIPQFLIQKRWWIWLVNEILTASQTGCVNGHFIDLGWIVFWWNMSWKIGLEPVMTILVYKGRIWKYVYLQQNISGWSWGSILCHNLCLTQCMKFVRCKKKSRILSYQNVKYRWCVRDTHATVRTGINQLRVAIADCIGSAVRKIVFRSLDWIPIWRKADWMWMTTIKKGWNDLILGPLMQEQSALAMLIYQF